MTRTTQRITLLAAAALVLAGCDDALGPRAPLTDLPPDLAAMGFEAEGRLGVPYVMLELHGGAGGFSGLVAVNGAGEPVWYHGTEGGPLGHARRRNGNFVLIDTERGAVEVTPGGRVVRTLAQEAAPGRAVHHDLLVTPHNTVLFLALDCRPHAGRSVCGEGIWEWVPETGEATRRWSAFDELDPGVDRGARSTDADWLHANALALGRRGDILVSLHFLNQVIAIAPDFSRITMRLGGVGATVTVDDRFSGQHTAQESGTDRVLLFDNGFERENERWSRAVEYEVRGARAVVVWQWRPSPDNWARIISGVRPMHNGNVMVGFGTPAGTLGSTGPIEVWEVTRSGAPQWHLTVGGPVAAMYRATPLPAF